MDAYNLLAIVFFGLAGVVSLSIIRDLIRERKGK